MQYGICPLSIVPLRFAPSNESEMISQLLYGEHFKILEERAKWSKIRVAFDAFEAWVQNKQIKKIEEIVYEDLDTQAPELSADLIEFIIDGSRRVRREIRNSEELRFNSINYWPSGRPLRPMRTINPQFYRIAV